MVHTLTEGLHARGHDVTLFAASGSKTSASLVECGPPVAEVEGAPPGYAAAREAVLLSQVRAAAAEFDVIHFHTEFMHAVFLDGLVPTLTTVHWRVDELDRQTYFEHFDKLPVAAISRSQAKQFPATANVRSVVHHGIDRDTYRAGPGGGGVAFLGRLTDQKGPDRAIRAARQAGMKIKLAGNIDIGNPAYFDKEVRPLLGADAEYVGKVNLQEKQDFLGLASVFAMPINWPEPFGLVMIEAMACGTPVVATPYGAAPEIVEDGVTGFIAEDGLEFAAALEAAQKLDRATIRQRFEARFPSDRMVADYEKTYAELLA